MLSRSDFKNVIKNTNLFAFDFIIRNHKNEVFLARRENAPAKGKWFVPGGRVLKNENLNDAFYRILSQETGLSEKDFSSIIQKGLYNHIYEDNFYEDTTFNTHYIVYAVEILLKNNKTIVVDNQHSQCGFFNTDYLMNHNNVHDNVKNYFTTRPDTLFKI